MTGATNLLTGSEGSGGEATNLNLSVHDGRAGHIGSLARAEGCVARKRHEDTLAQRRPAGSYAPRPNRFGIQNWRMASTTVGMSRHASRSKDGVLRPRHCESRTGRPAGSTQW